LGRRRAPDGRHRGSLGAEEKAPACLKGTGLEFNEGHYIAEAQGYLAQIRLLHQEALDEFSRAQGE
jgi:hypothetical protein